MHARALRSAGGPRSRGGVLLAGCALAAGLLLTSTVPAHGAGEPVNTEPPELTRSGERLSTTDGTWVGRTEPYSYAWLRCEDATLGSCIFVQGQRNPDYELTPADAGKRIRSRVTASNEAGSASELSAPTAVIEGRSPPPGKATPKLSPFPVVVVAGRQRRALTRVAELTVRGPRGAIVRLRCRGRGCPVRRISRVIGRGERVRLRRAERTYRAGSVLEVRVVDDLGERMGKFTRVRFRRSRTPARRDSCLEPGERRPVACP